MLGGLFSPLCNRLLGQAMGVEHISNLNQLVRDGFMIYRANYDSFGKRGSKACVK